jgi:hypothetical protein
MIEEVCVLFSFFELFNSAVSISLYVKKVSVCLFYVHFHIVAPVSTEFGMMI